jgi:hypothetical protein
MVGISIVDGELPASADLADCAALRPAPSLLASFALFASILYESHV